MDVDEIARVLVDRADAARSAGIRADAILVDPGLGFGKDTATDLRTLHEVPRLARLGYPLLLAPSHKEVTAEPLGLAESSMEGTAAVVALAAYLGAAVLRVHDLPFMGHVARMAWLIAAARGRCGFAGGTVTPPVTVPGTGLPAGTPLSHRRNFSAAEAARGAKPRIGRRREAENGAWHRPTRRHTGVTRALRRRGAQIAGEE